MYEKMSDQEKAAVLEKAKASANDYARAAVDERAAILGRAAVDERAAMLNRASVQEKAAMFDRAPEAERAQAFERAVVERATAADLQRADLERKK